MQGTKYGSALKYYESCGLITLHKENSLTIDNVSIGVPNINNSRELKVDVKENPASLSDVIVKQTELAIAKNKEYTLSFDAYGE